MHAHVHVSFRKLTCHSLQSRWLQPIARERHRILRPAARERHRILRSAVPCPGPAARGARRGGHGSGAELVTFVCFRRSTDSTQPPARRSPKPCLSPSGGLEAFPPPDLALFWPCALVGHAARTSMCSPRSPHARSSPSSGASSKMEREPGACMWACGAALHVRALFRRSYAHHNSGSTSTLGFCVACVVRREREEVHRE